jgi:hypothetical protein
MTKTIELWKIANVARCSQNDIERAIKGYGDTTYDFTGAKIIWDVAYILKRYKDMQKKRSTRELNEYSYMTRPLTKAKLMRSYRQEKNKPSTSVWRGTLEQLFSMNSNDWRNVHENNKKRKRELKV